MKIERFEVPGLAQYSYIVSSGGRAAVIDPIRDIETYLQYAAAHALKITHVLETHIHADFASGAAVLAESAGAELALSAYDAGEQYQCSMPHRRLRDGDSIEVGGVRLQALHTPGHTPEHLSFLLFDAERSGTQPAALFSGDFLFVGSLGRPDLLGDGAKQGLAHDLYRSLNERIASLPDAVALYPGHGAGSLCGAGMSERAESTLGYERAANPFFMLAEEAFVAEILASVPPMPDYYPRMKALNSQGAPGISTMPGSRAIPASEVAIMSQRRNAILLDLRRPEAFGGAHIEGAINIGAGQNLSLWAGWLLDPGKPIVLIGNSGDDVASRLSLLRVGLDRIEGFLEKGMPSWIDAGLPFARTTQLSTQEVEQRPANSLVVDVRSDKEWNAGHIAGAKHIMLGDLARSVDALPMDRPLIAVCGSGYRSTIAASILAQHGFSDNATMAGGMAAWQRKGLPLSHK